MFVFFITPQDANDAVCSAKHPKDFGEKTISKDIHLFLAEEFNILSVMDFGIYLFMVNLLGKWKMRSRCLGLIGLELFILFIFSSVFFYLASSPAAAEPLISQLTDRVTSWCLAIVSRG